MLIHNYKHLFRERFIKKSILYTNSDFSIFSKKYLDTNDFTILITYHNAVISFLVNLNDNIAYDFNFHNCDKSFIKNIIDTTEELQYEEV